MTSGGFPKRDGAAPKRSDYPKVRYVVEASWQTLDGYSESDTKVCTDEDEARRVVAAWRIRHSGMPGFTIDALRETVHGKNLPVERRSMMARPEGTLDAAVAKHGLAAARAALRERNRPDNQE